MPTIHSDSVRIVLFDRTAPERFLILDESDDVGNFKLPGGKVQVDESADTAADRELREEVKLAAADVALRAAAMLLNLHDVESKKYIYIGEVDPERVNPTNEIASIAWVTRETVPEGENQGHIIAAVDQALGLLETDNSFQSNK